MRLILVGAVTLVFMFLFSGLPQPPAPGIINLTTSSGSNLKVTIGGNIFSFFVSTDGEKAFFASNQLDGVGGFDIFSFPLYDEARPQRVLFLKGKLTDEDG